MRKSEKEFWMSWVDVPLMIFSALTLVTAGFLYYFLFIEDFTFTQPLGGVGAVFAVITAIIGMIRHSIKQEWEKNEQNKTT